MQHLDTTAAIIQPRAFSEEPNHVFVPLNLLNGLIGHLQNIGVADTDSCVASYIEMIDAETDPQFFD